MHLLNVQLTTTAHGLVQSLVCVLMVHIHLQVIKVSKIFHNVHHVQQVTTVPEVVLTPQRCVKLVSIVFPVQLPTHTRVILTTSARVVSSVK